MMAEEEKKKGETKAKGRRRRLPVVLSREEVVKLLEAPDNDRDRLILRLLYATGMRIGVLANLQVCDIDWDDAQIFVRGGKGDKDRYVNADPQTFAMLAEYVKDKAPEEKIFDIGARRMQRIVEQYGDSTGVQPKYTAMGRTFSAHTLRHTYATYLYENGMGLGMLKTLMGHERLETTEIYIYVAARKRREEYMKYHPLAAGKA
jgi:integrase